MIQKSTFHKIISTGTMAERRLKFLEAKRMVRRQMEERGASKSVETNYSKILKAFKTIDIVPQRG